MSTRQEPDREAVRQLQRTLLHIMRERKLKLIEGVDLLHTVADRLVQPGIVAMRRGEPTVTLRDD